MASPATRIPRRVIRSFGYAAEGIVTVLVTQPNAWVHTLAAVIVLGLGWALRLSGTEFALLILTIGLVFAAEAANTAIESLCDAVIPDHHPLVKRAKDAAAGSVLLAAIAAVGVAAALLGPRLLALAANR